MPPPAPVLQLVRSEGRGGGCGGGGGGSGGGGGGEGGETAARSAELDGDPTTEMRLEWGPGGPDPETLFYTLELVLSGLNKFRLPVGSETGAPAPNKAF